MTITPIFKGSVGLNTVLDPLRIPYDPESGIMSLSAAVNVTVDESGMIRTREGFSSEDDGDWHSLFCDGGDCIGVRGTDLCVISEDLSFAVIKEGIADRLSYTQINNDIYYTSPSAHGIVRDGLYVDWEAQDYVGPDTNRSFSGPFNADHIAFHLSRVWLAKDGYIVFSEPFGWSWFDFHRSLLPFASEVVMMKPVAQSRPPTQATPITQGLWISDKKATYFLGGSQPKEFNLIKVAPYPAIEWNVATDLVEGLEIGLEAPGLCAVWASPEGACLGTATGQMINLTKDKVLYPEVGQTGAGILSNYNFIHTIGV